MDNPIGGVECGKKIYQKWHTYCGEENWYVIASGGDVIARISSDSQERELVHQIVAAPELHEATLEYQELLKHLLSVVTVFSKPEVKDYVPFGLTEQLWVFINSDKARQALAKAEDKA